VAVFAWHDQLRNLLVNFIEKKGSLSPGSLLAFSFGLWRFLQSERGGS
jgi:hypothetical protein